jgi:hypothetical protein
MIPDPAVLQRPPATVLVTVPQVATTAADGLPAVLAGRRVRLELPVWEAPNGSAGRAWLRVGATSCPAVPLRPGAVVRVSCTATVPPSARVVVAVVTDRGVVARWRHRTR